MKNPYEKDGYVLPIGPAIGRSSTTEDLYDAEEKVVQSIHEAAEEFQKLWDENKGFYEECIPEVLLQMLESFDNKASELAAISFLLKHGYEIVRKEESEV